MTKGPAHPHDDEQDEPWVQKAQCGKGSNRNPSGNVEPYAQQCGGDECGGDRDQLRLLFFELECFAAFALHQIDSGHCCCGHLLKRCGRHMPMKT